jgi:hypothetical protein
MQGYLYILQKHDNIACANIDRSYDNVKSSPEMFVQINEERKNHDITTLRSIILYNIYEKYFLECTISS